MKAIIALLALSFMVISCDNTGAEAEPEADNMADEMFKKNSETVLANLKGWQEENLD